MPKSVMLQPGNWYSMHSTEPRLIIFKFVNVGHYLVDGQEVRAASDGDLCVPYTISDGPHEYHGPHA